MTIRPFCGKIKAGEWGQNCMAIKLQSKLSVGWMESKAHLLLAEALLIWLWSWFSFFNSFKECGMQKQRSCYKPLILTVRFAPLYGPNLKKKLFHLTDSVKISSLSGNTIIKDTPSKKLRNCMDIKAEFCIFRFVRKEILLWVLLPMKLWDFGEFLEPLILLIQKIILKQIYFANQVWILGEKSLHYLFILFIYWRLYFYFTLFFF